MSVDVLQPKFTLGPTFNYPHIPQMKETRGTQIEMRPHHRTIEDANTKINVNHFDPNCIIYDSTTDTTYLRGRLLGKVSFDNFSL